MYACSDMSAIVELSPISYVCMYMRTYKEVAAITVTTCTILRTINIYTCTYECKLYQDDICLLNADENAFQVIKISAIPSSSRILQIMKTCSEIYNELNLLFYLFYLFEE